ncbi:hypothetical protein Tco_0389996 [Tanacetum coccineum]
MLLSRAITQKFSTPTNNRLFTSSNTRNQAVIQDDGVDIQAKNTGYGGNADALTTIANVPAVYLQQFWKTVNKVSDTKDTIKFKLDSQEITYTVDMFRDTLKLPVETLDNLFIAPVNINVIESFMQTVGYQGVVDKVGSFYTKFLAQPWQTMFKIPILNSFLTDEIHTTDDYNKYEMVFVLVEVPKIQPQPVISTQGTHRTTPSAYRSPTLTTTSPQRKKGKQVFRDTSSPRKSLKVTIKQKHVVEGEKDDKSYARKFAASMFYDDVDDYNNTLEPGSHKENPEVIDDDDVNDDEKKYGMKDEVEDKDNDDRTDHALSEVPALISKEFDAYAPKIIEELFKHYVQTNVIQVHPTITTITDTTSSTDLQQQLYLKMKSNLQDQANDPALWDVLKRKFEKSSTSNTSCRDDDFHSQHHDDHQEDDAPLEGEKKEWDAWEEEIVMDEDKVIPEGETPKLIIEFQNVDKRIPTIFDHARMEATLNDMLSDQFRNAEENPNGPPRHLYSKDLFFLKNGNTGEKKYILSLHMIHTEPFLEVDLEEKMNRWDRKEFKNFNEDARITEVVRITTDQLYGLDFMEQIIVMRANDKPDSFSEADFKYLKKIDIEDLYYLCQNKKSITVKPSC